MGPTTDATRAAALTVRKNELLAKVEAAGGALLAGTWTGRKVKPGTGEVYGGKLVDSAVQNELTLIESQLAALQPSAPVTGGTGGSTTVAPVDPGPYFYSQGTPGRRTLMRVKTEEGYAAAGVDLVDRAMEG